MGAHVVMKAVRLHCQPGPSLASETLCGSAAATATPAVTAAATTIESNRRLFQLGFMTGPFQGCENLDDHLVPADVVPARNVVKRGKEKRPAGVTPPTLFLRLPAFVLTGSAAFAAIHNIASRPPAGITTLL